MAFKKSEDSSPRPSGPISKELPSSYPLEVDQEVHRHHNWPMLVALTIASLAFAVLVVIGGRWAYHASKHHKTTPASSHGLPQPPPANL